MVILAAIDENERSARVARLGYDLATAYDETLVALHVIPTEEYEEHRQALSEIPGIENLSLTQETGSAKRFARRFVVEMVPELDRNRLEPKGRVGNVSREILAEVDSIEPRFLVIGGRRQSPAGKAIFGNTAQELLLNANCPVVSDLTDD
jgi:nucleotide-binding universal stress UspA family protein